MKKDKTLLEKNLSVGCKRQIVKSYILDRKVIEMKKDQLAEVVGVSKPTLYKYLGELMNEGLIDYIPDNDWGWGCGVSKRIVVRGGENE